MNKIARCFKDLVILSSLLGFVPAADASDSWLFAAKKPAFYSSSPAEHTYACVTSPYGSVDCYSVAISGVSGTTSGGTIIGGTTSFSGKYYCYSQCPFVYAVTGVCHQHTNRILYDGNMTLNSSTRGYSASVFLYGATGDNHWISSFALCRLVC